MSSVFPALDGGRPVRVIDTGIRGGSENVAFDQALIERSAYHMLGRRVPYQNLGPAHFDARDRTRTATRLLKPLKEPGIEVLETRVSEPSLEPVSF